MARCCTGRVGGVERMSTREEIINLIKAAGKYELGEENCEGMNAYAFPGRHLPLNRDVFLKVYHADASSSEIFREPRFLVEATKGGTKPGNLVEVYDAEFLGGDQFVLVAMEYVKGGSLLKRIEAGGPLALMDAIRAAVGLLHGVAQLHAAGFVHRDIKPANILLARQGSSLIPKLGDFGSVARLAAPNATVTASKHSALYVPPEGWAEPSQYGILSDLYQVGMVLHEMANGPLPYSAESHLDRAARSELKQRGFSMLKAMDDYDACKLVEAAIARRTSKGKLLELGPKQPYIPRQLRHVISKATSPSPQDRYQTASEFIGALETLSFPNWHPVNGSIFEALAWNGRDWRIETLAKPTSADRFVVRMAPPGAQTFRRRAVTQDILKAADFVARGK